MGEYGFDPRGVANLILRMRKRLGRKTTHLELQKLIYFSHGYFVSRFSRPLVQGYFEAWKDGPVHPYLYNVFKKHGRDPIDSLAEDLDLISGEVSVVQTPSDPLARRVVGSIVFQLQGLTAGQLRAKSHIERGPWHSVMVSAKINLASNLRIPDTVISTHYFRHLVSEVGPLDPLEMQDDVEDHPPESYRSG